VIRSQFLQETSALTTHSNYFVFLRPVTHTHTHTRVEHLHVF